jgi:hypothetical protein
LALEVSLLPGEKRPFSLSAALPGGQVVGFEFLVQGLVIGN